MLYEKMFLTRKKTEVETGDEREEKLLACAVTTIFFFLNQEMECLLKSDWEMISVKQNWYKR